MTLSAAPLFDEVADGPTAGAAYWVNTSDEVRIRVGRWVPPNAKGTVLLFPGRTEYIEKYGRAANELYQRSYATICVDWRGQGLADRLLDDPRIGHVNLFTDYQKDVEAVLRAARELDLPQPYYLLAHSMGGCIGLRALFQGLPVQAVVFSGPMWGIRMTPLTRLVAWVLATSSGWVGQGGRLLPGGALAAPVKATPFESNLLTCDSDMFAYMVTQIDRHPELSLGSPSLHWLREALHETRNLAAQPSPNLPCLTYMGDNERIVDVDRIAQRMRNWPGSHFKTIGQAKHEVLMESPAVSTPIFEATASLFAEHNDKGVVPCRA